MSSLKCRGQESQTCSSYQRQFKVESRFSQNMNWNLGFYVSCIEYILSVDRRGFEEKEKERKN